MHSTVHVSLFEMNSLFPAAGNLSATRRRSSRFSISLRQRARQSGEFPVLFLLIRRSAAVTSSFRTPPPPLSLREQRLSRHSQVLNQKIAGFRAVFAVAML